MILRNFYINLSIDLKDKKAIDYRYDFNTKTRHICNYIERNCLKKIRFESDLFQAIVIELRYGFNEDFMKVDPFISPNKSLAIINTFDKKRYDEICTDEKNFRVFIREIIDENLRSVKGFDLPIEQILDCCEKLKDNCFVNEWILKRKTDKQRNLLVELQGEMKIDKFVLTLRAFKNKVEIYNQEIMETDADENDYLSKVKKLVIEGNEIKVLGVRDRVSFSVILEKLDSVSS